MTCFLDHVCHLHQHLTLVYFLVPYLPPPPPPPPHLLHTYKHNSQQAAFAIYLPYCKNKLVSDAVRSMYDGYFQERQASLGQKLNIEDLLIAPIHRFTKYQLLIKVGGGQML